MNGLAEQFESFSHENAALLIDGEHNPQVMPGFLQQDQLHFQTHQYKGQGYQWSATQYDEHPDFMLSCEAGNIWVQVELGLQDKIHHHGYLNYNKIHPFSTDTAIKVLTAIIDNGYLDKYFQRKMKLVFNQQGNLVEV